MEGKTLNANLHLEIILKMQQKLLGVYAYLFFMIEVQE